MFLLGDVSGSECFPSVGLAPFGYGYDLAGRGFWRTGCRLNAGRNGRLSCG